MTKRVYLQRMTTAFFYQDWMIGGAAGDSSGYLDSRSESDWQVSAITVESRDQVFVDVTVPPLALPGTYTIKVKGEPSLFKRHWLYEGTFEVP